MARSLIFKAKNSTGATVSARTVVYISGFDSNGIISTFGIASYNLNTRMPAVGVVDEDVADEDTTNIKIVGTISGFDTSGREINDPVYVGYNGSVIFQDPANINSSFTSQQIGVVSRVGTGDNGWITLYPLEVRDVPLHAGTHSAGGYDEFIHASQHETGGGDIISHTGLGNLTSDTHPQYPIFATGSANKVAYWETARRLTRSDEMAWDQTNSILTVGDGTNGTIITPKMMITPEGGLAIQLTNKTGTTSIKGTVVDTSDTTDDAFETSDTGSDDAIGVVYEDGISDGSECWVVVSGKADVLLEDGTASTHGYWVQTSDVQAGRADATAADPPGAAVSHWQEIGHCVESVASGIDKMARMVLHFN